VIISSSVYIIRQSSLGWQGLENSQGFCCC